MDVELEIEHELIREFDWELSQVSSHIINLDLFELRFEFEVEPSKGV